MKILLSGVIYIICKKMLIIINDAIWEFSRFNLITNLLGKITHKMLKLITEKRHNVTKYNTTPLS
jgi:DNA-binding HxlR family transcriptional regulator